MSFFETFAGMALAAFVFAFANYKARRPYEPGKAFQVPYLAIQFLAIVAIVVMIAYLLSQGSS